MPGVTAIPAGSTGYTEVGDQFALSFRIADNPEGGWVVSAKLPEFGESDPCRFSD